MPKTLEVKTANEKKLLKKHNVVGAAVGEKWSQGTPTGQDAVLVFVEKKMSKKSVSDKYSEKDLVPSDIDGIPTDVIEVGTIKKLGHKKKVRPIIPGFSVGHGKITAGTIGGVFRDRDGTPVILSNNHVLADENAAKVGDLIYQPGPIDNRANKRNRGWPDPVANLPYIGTLKKFVKLNRTRNLQDSAIAAIHEKLIEDGLISDVYPTIKKRLAGFANPRTGTQVQKEGRTTGYTTGRVIGQHASFTVGYDFGNAKFMDCVVLSAMSRGGDSGSIVSDMDMNAVGLLFAGSSRVTIANPMTLVQKHYGLKLWTPPEQNKQPTIDTKARWQQFAAPGTDINVSGKTISISAEGNVHCYLEHPVIGSFKVARCTINTGTDYGATWGPGLVVQWPNGMLKVNLRKGGSFGGYFNSNYNVRIGKTKPNTDYQVRIFKTAKTWAGQVYDGRKWHTVVEVPQSIFPTNPVAVRVGKTGLLGHSRNHSRAGKRGDCQIKNFRMA